MSGGQWTIEKLDILERYLDAYTTALKNTHFHLVYIDAFAGTGKVLIRTRDQEFQAVIDGSAQRAIGVTNKKFDRLVFVDKKREPYRALKGLKLEYPARDIQIERMDANCYLQRLKLTPEWRGVLFIDPFATQLNWSTLARVAKMQKLDTWILFPTMAVQRVLQSKYPKGRFPQGFKKALKRVYGSEEWLSLYRPHPQESLFEETPTTMSRSSGTKDLLDLYGKNLRREFGGRFLSQTRSLKNGKGRDLFELMFCVGHKAGVKPAKRIAKHLMEHF